MADTQTLIRETVDRLRQVQEENEMHQRRRDELEARISSLETEYEELLGASDATLSPCCALTLHSFRMQRRPFMTRKSATSTSLSPWRSSR